MEQLIKKLKRPKGVTIICILDTVSLGFMPLATLYITMSKFGVSVIGLLDPLITVLFSIATFMSAFHAINGSTKGRNYLIGLVIVNVVSVALINGATLLNPQSFGIEQLTTADKGRMFSYTVSKLTLLIINLAYFRSLKATEYYNARSPV